MYGFIKLIIHHNIVKLEFFNAIPKGLSIKVTPQVPRPFNNKTHLSFLHEWNKIVSTVSKLLLKALKNYHLNNINGLNNYINQNCPYLSTEDASELNRYKDSYRKTT